jgi:glutathione transport system substrate-binding protein
MQRSAKVRFNLLSTRSRQLTLALAVTLVALMGGTAYAQSVLTVLQAEAPRSMDPGDHTASVTSTILEPMYEGLVLRDKDLKIAPSLATEWTNSEAGKVWTFKLRPGVKFHDGTPFNAEAVVHSFERFLDKSRGLAAAGRITAVIASVKAIDDTTVEFTLKAPYSGFLTLLTTNTAKIVSEKADEAGNLGAVPVGTGAFKFVEWKSGEYVLEARNDNYWGDKPSMDELKFTWSGEASVLSMSVQSGNADVVYPLPPTFAPTIKSNPDLKLLDTEGSFVYWMSLNTKLKPLDNVKVRQALNFATDRGALVAALLRGYGTAANSPLPPTNPFYDKSLATYTYDPEKAKALLAEAGLPNGFTMTTAVAQRDAPIAEALQGMWAKVGVTLDIRNQESGVWSKTAFADPAGKQADNLASTIASWSSGSFNPDLQLRPLYATASWSPGGANLGFFSDPHLDELIDKGAAEIDDAKAKVIYEDAQKLINEEAPHVLLYSRRDLVATSAKVSNVWMTPGGVVTVQYAIKAK